MTSSNGTINSAKANQQPHLRVIPLGGLHEIGKNTCVFEYGDDIMLVDAGLAFPSDGMHGVNVVMPDTSYLRESMTRDMGANAIRVNVGFRGVRNSTDGGPCKITLVNGRSSAY